MYNYVEQCKLKGLAHTRESHVVRSSVTYSKQRVLSPTTRVHHRLKLRRDRHHHHHRLLTPQQLAGNRGTLRQQQSDCSHTVLVPTAKTIPRRSLFHFYGRMLQILTQGKIYSKKYGMPLTKSRAPPLLPSCVINLRIDSRQIHT